MPRSIREARAEDIPQLMPVFDAARQIMRQSGNTSQWVNGYPSEDVVRNDLARHGGFVIEDDGQLVGYFAFLPSPEPTYAQICEGAWLDDESYYVIHRLASLPDVHGI